MSEQDSFSYDPLAAFEEYYQDFEALFFRDKPFWRAPVATIREPLLQDLFLEFQRLFPDHPTDVNSVFYLSRGSIYFACLHFENDSTEDVTNLAGFLMSLGTALGDEADTCGLEMYSSFAEELILKCLLPSAEAQDWIRRAAGKERTSCSQG